MCGSLWPDCGHRERDIVLWLNRLQKTKAEPCWICESPWTDCGHREVELQVVVQTDDELETPDSDRLAAGRFVRDPVLPDPLVAVREHEELADGQRRRNQRDLSADHRDHLAGRFERIPCAAGPGRCERGIPQSVRRVR